MPFKLISFTFFLFLSFLNVQAQEKPKLVVGIVVDQMRYEYLHRFAVKYGNDGFKKLMEDGFNSRNTHYNYVPTYTAPGHSSIFTGTTPSVHGIISNDWYDKESDQYVYCVEDTLMSSVGVENGKGISPQYLLTTTIADELKLSTQFESKTIGISAKDRGAVLPVGKSADAAYWYDKTSGKFITSTYYMSELPNWVDKFNKRKLADEYMSMTWNTLLSIDQYTESDKDANKFEYDLGNKGVAIFPYNLSEINEKSKFGYELVLHTPFGNSIITEMAIAAIEGEKLGKGRFMDMLTVSYSSTDYIGHIFGPNSVELEDTYIRLDLEIAKLINALDQSQGNGNYTLFLTSDHGVVDIPNNAMTRNIPAGYLDKKGTVKLLKDHLNTLYGENEWIKSVSNYQVFLNTELIKSKEVDISEMKKVIVDLLILQNGIVASYTSDEVKNVQSTELGIKGALHRGYNQKKSGDVLFSLSSGWLQDNSGITTHGSSYSYDTHVPMIFYGWGIKKGSTVQYHPITDIAPTISTLLNIKFPSGCTGQPIIELFD